METLYLLAISQGLLMLFFLFRKKNRNQANIALSFWILSICLVLGSSYLYKEGLVSKYPHLVGIDMATPFLCGPLLYIYIHLILNPGKKLTLPDYIHFGPFFLFLTYLTITLYAKDAAFKSQIVNGELHLMPRTAQIFVYLTSIFQAFIYSLIVYHKLRKTEIENSRLKTWLKVFTGGILVINSLFFGVFIGKVYALPLLSYFKIEYFNMAIFIMVYLMIIVALKYPNLFDYYVNLQRR